MNDKDTLAGQAGIDLWTCEFCEQPVRKSDDYIQGLDGMRAHRRCVYAYDPDDKSPPPAGTAS